ncbi:MAG: molybdopterin molybdotransferase MoeA, partial [Pseudomonadota bacterium]
MVTPERALALILEAIKPVSRSESVALSRVHQRVLARDCPARKTQPPCDLSAMDGYALPESAWRGNPTRLHLAGTARPGEPRISLSAPGQAIRILTGAAIPEGCDSVVIQEETRIIDDMVEIMARPQPGRFIRPCGMDFAEGDRLIKAGTWLNARSLALLAAMNYASVPVVEKPKITIINTGDELVMPGKLDAGKLDSGKLDSGKLDSGQHTMIISSNGFSLAALLEAHGARCDDAILCPDDLEQFVAILNANRDADLVITTGGASVGDHDVVASAVTANHLVPSYQKIAMRPGKPVMFSRFGELPVLSLPGNPVSVMVSTLLLILPALQKLTGKPVQQTIRERAIIDHDLATGGKREHYMRAQFVEDPKSSEHGHAEHRPARIRAFPEQDSAQLSILYQADGLIIRPAGAKPLAAGASLEWIPF